MKYVGHAQTVTGIGTGFIGCIAKFWIKGPGGAATLHDPSLSRVGIDNCVGPQPNRTVVYDMDGGKKTEVSTVPMSTALNVTSGNQTSINGTAVNNGTTVANKTAEKTDALVGIPQPTGLFNCTPYNDSIQCILAHDMCQWKDDIWSCYYFNMTAMMEAEPEKEETFVQKVMGYVIMAGAAVFGLLCIGCCYGYVMSKGDPIEFGDPNKVEFPDLPDNKSKKKKDGRRKR